VLSYVLFALQSASGVLFDCECYLFACLFAVYIFLSGKFSLGLMPMGAYLLAGPVNDRLLLYMALS
jgi:hypothetical protein